MQQIIRTYKIGDIIFKLILPFSYEELQAYEEYRVDEQTADVEVEFIEQVYKVPIQDKYFDVEQMRITLTTDIIYMELLEGDMKTVYGCLVLPRRERHRFKCYLYGNAREQLPFSMQIFKVLTIEHYLNLYKRSVLHASYIDWNGRAILFTAPSGTGKSTQAELWKQYEGAKIINGDKVVVGESEGTMYAFGLPYAGSSTYFENETLSLGAIVVLEQGTSNVIKKLNEIDAVKKIYSETIVHSWDKDYVNRTMNEIIKIVKKVPVFLLTCTPDRRAVDILKEELEKIYGVD